MCLLAEERAEERPRWAPRLPPHKLRRLYANDAHGIVDAMLIDDVGLTLYLRCQANLAVAEIRHSRQAPCPRCGALVPIDDWSDETRILGCSCGWRLAWGRYLATFRHKELGAGGAGPIFAEYLRRWDVAASPRDRMLAIDWLIHMWHWELAEERPSFDLGRPTGVNLIEGSRHQTIELLDSLTYGHSSTTATLEMRDRWRANLASVRERGAAWKRSRMAGHITPQRREGD